jgi:hypothetical protein
VLYFESVNLQGLTLLCSVQQTNILDAVFFNSALFVLYLSSDRIPIYCLVDRGPITYYIRRGCRCNRCMFVHSLFSHSSLMLPLEIGTRSYHRRLRNRRVRSTRGRHLSTSTISTRGNVSFRPQQCHETDSCTERSRTSS